MTDQLYIIMNDGYRIPVVGLGTWKSEPGEATYRAVLDSINAGYRHIDTARAYDNESDVGKAVKDTNIDRKELFITTKLWNKDQGYDTAIEACEKSLVRLGCDYIDLYLIHWPLKGKRNDSWRAFIELQESCNMTRPCSSGLPDSTNSGRNKASRSRKMADNPMKAPFSLPTLSIEPLRIRR